MNVTREQVQSWLDAYVEAWRSYDPAAIGDLFTEDARYAYRPHEARLEGREAIVASWSESPDAPGSWEAGYAPFMIEGDRAIATGETFYPAEGRFSNLFVLRFAEDGRCSEFVEWFIQQD